MQYYDHLLKFSVYFGLFANLVFIIDLFWPIRKAVEQIQDSKKGRRSKMRSISIGVAFIAVIASIGFFAYATGDAFKNEQLTRDAWRALDAKEYDVAIKKAEECVSLFHEEALQEQKSLEQKNASAPPKGKVGKEEKEIIFKRGLLNDVASCWFILGKTHAAKGDKEKAEKAFNKALLFPYARCYDISNESFWAPSDGAKVELRKLSGKSIYD